MKFAVSLAPSFPSFAWFTFSCLASMALSPRARAQPPAWPDVHQVANGCYLSTALYLAKLREHYPGVTARAENVRLPTGKMHTIAIVQWGRKTYLRDMFIGVASVKRDTQCSFDEAVSQWRRNGGRHNYSERIVSTFAERLLEVQVAAQWMAAFHPQIIEVFSPTGPLPVLCWTTAEGEMAFYEPSIGTAVGLTQRAPVAVANELFGSRKAGPGSVRVARLSTAPTSDSSN